jgi:hypothetical protein
MDEVTIPIMRRVFFLSIKRIDYFNSLNILKSRGYFKCKNKSAEYRTFSGALDQKN